MAFSAFPKPSLTPADETRLVACAEQLVALSASSALTFAEALYSLSAEGESLSVAAVEHAFAWAHPMVRAQALEALEAAAVLRYTQQGIVVDQERAQAVRVALRSVAPYHALKSHPPLYLTPPALLRALDAEVGELRRLLVSLVAGVRERLIVITPFFAQEAVQEVLAPLKNARRGIELTLYISMEEARLAQATVLWESLQAIGTLRTCALYIALRPQGRWETIPHAKLVLCDGREGYLGSANISRQGLHEQFEVGVRLDEKAVEALEQALTELQRRGVYQSYQEVLATNFRD